MKDCYVIPLQSLCIVRIGLLGVIFTFMKINGQCGGTSPCLIKPNH